MVENFDRASSWYELANKAIDDVNDNLREDVEKQALLESTPDLAATIGDSLETRIQRARTRVAIYWAQRMDLVAPFHPSGKLLALSSEVLPPPKSSS